MKKRAIVFALVLVLVIVTLVVCGCKNTTLSPATLYKKGIKMTSLMGDMIKNSTFLELRGISSSSSSTKEFYANDYDTPIRTYIVAVPSNESILEKAMSMTDTDRLDKLKELPENLYKQFSYMATFDLVIMNMIHKNSSFDETLICQSLIAQEVVEGTLEKDVAYLYTFETGKPIIVYFSQQAPNSIFVRSYFIGKNNFTTLSDAREAFAEFDCNVSKYN